MRLLWWLRRRAHEAGLHGPACTGMFCRPLPHPSTDPDG